MAKKLAILGAGITGLSLAYFLQKRFGNALDITLFEAADKPGGWMQTLRHDDALFEYGPRSLRARNDSALIQLINELGIQNEMIFPAKTAKERYVVHKGVLKRVPYSFFFVRELLWGILRRPFLKREASSEEGLDSTVSAHFEKRFGARFTRYFVDPLMRGIYAITPDELSKQACSITGAQMKGATMFSFKEGAGFLPRILAEKLQACILYRTPVYHVREVGSKVHIQAEGKYLEADFVISTLSAPKICALLNQDDPLSECLRQIKMSSLVTVSVGSKNRYKIPSGFGFLCPSCEEKELLGVLFDSNVFPEHNGSYKTRFSVMMSDQNDESAHARAASYVEKYLGLDVGDDYFIVKRVPDAIARYSVGHKARVAAIESITENRRLAILGSSFYGVSIGDCVASALSFVNKQISF
jgi:oxygen-dependent protoporphyrinogen oxidase